MQAIQRRASKIAAAALAAAAALLGSCTTITIDPNDGSPPVFTVSLLYPRSHPEVAASGRVVPFTIEILGDRQTFGLLFVARDPQSGIRSGRVHVHIAYNCGEEGPDRVPFPREFISDLDFPSSVDGSRVLDHSAAALSMTMQDLWRGGHCEELGQTVGHRSGAISSIRGDYTLTSFNNASPTREGRLEGGTFSIVNPRGGPITIALDD